MDVRRLIAPLTERWNEGERDWAFVKDPNHDIARWEESTGLSLPDGYRRFMLRFNGGRVYPRLFHCSMGRPDSQGEFTTFIDPFYSWTKVETYTRGDMYGKGTPPEMLFIGCDPGALKFSCRFVRRITDIFFVGVTARIFGAPTTMTGFGTRPRPLKLFLARCTTSRTGRIMRVGAPLCSTSSPSRSCFRPKQSFTAARRGPDREASWRR